MMKSNAARAVEPFRLVEDGAGAGERGDRQAVPVGEHLVVAAGLRPRLAQREEFRPRGGERRLLVGDPRGVTRRSTVCPSQLPPRVTS